MISRVFAFGCLLTILAPVGIAIGAPKLQDVYMSQSADVSGPTLNGEARGAAIIARVHLVSRTPVNLRPESTHTWQSSIGEGDGPSCGYLYHATVVDSIKGGSEPFDFFSSIDADFTGYNHDYLVIVFKRSENTKPLNLFDTYYTIPEDDGRQLNCLLSQKYYVARIVQSMFSFDAEATKQLDGDWLLEPNRRAPGWCGYLKRNLVKVGEKSYRVGSWQQLREALVENAGAGPYMECS